MTTVWVLSAIFISQPFIGPITVQHDTLVYQSAEACLRHIDSVKKQLEKYDLTRIECEERKLN